MKISTFQLVLWYFLFLLGYTKYKSKDNHLNGELCFRVAIIENLSYLSHYIGGVPWHVACYHCTAHFKCRYNHAVRWSFHIETYVLGILTCIHTVQNTLMEQSNSCVDCYIRAYYFICSIAAYVHCCNGRLAMDWEGSSFW